nr:HAMP domain-containing sensor histidine kinase [Pseudoalteromonas caenipelagi]
MNESVRRVQQSVEREQKFLAYASHELRTPIATVSSNAELLKKMLKGDFPKEKHMIGLERIERAAMTMGALTETLLWLNRGVNNHVSINKICLSDLITQLISELGYLITDKKVELVLETDETQMNLPETVCRIILQNVIRNAYIHTNEGVVSIIQTGPEIIIQNIDYQPELHAELGFGLGLELTQRLISHYQWQFVSKEGERGRTVTITFKS